MRPPLTRKPNLPRRNTRQQLPQCRGWTFADACPRKVGMRSPRAVRAAASRVILMIALVCGVQMLASLDARSVGAWQQAVQGGEYQAEAEASTPAMIEVAWDQAGCQVNPGNPNCVLLGRIATCDSTDRDPACTDDADGDGCMDLTEMIVGLDPQRGNDCLGDAAGRPLLNCLFSQNNASCNTNSDTLPLIDCPLFARDPLCDGFGP